MSQRMSKDVKRDMSKQIIRRTGVTVASLGYIFARMQKKARLSAKKGNRIHSSSVVEGGSQVVDTTIGRHSFCGYDCTIMSTDIGSFCSISDNVYIGGSAHPVEYVSTSPVFLSHRDSVRKKFARHPYYNLPRTTVGHDVWLAYGVRVKAGVTIGHGAVVGIGAVVTKDVDPYAIVAGNPARIIKWRFENRLVEALLKAEWWNYHDEKLTDAAMDFDDPEKFLRKLGFLKDG